MNRNLLSGLLIGVFAGFLAGYFVGASRSNEDAPPVAAAQADHGHHHEIPLRGGGQLAEDEAWVARNLTDEASRRAAVALLVERSAREFASPAATRLEQLGSVFGRSVD